VVTATYNQQLSINNVLRTGVDNTRKIRGVENTYNTTSNINSKYTKYITYYRHYLGVIIYYDMA